MVRDTMTASMPPCRLWVLLARDRPIALILRRGPSPWYHLVRWHTDTDRLEHGAWFKGRIYEERCDLSPDGELFLYFALKGSRWRTTYKGTWTAVSRPPWLHALVLWPEGSTWGGGGRFVDRRKVVLRGCALATHPDHPLVGLEAALGTRADFPAVADFPPREWSGHDHAGDRVFTSGGRLFRERGKTVVEIADFNGLTPDPQPAPDWAQKPLPPLRGTSGGAKRTRRAARPAAKPRTARAMRVKRVYEAPAPDDGRRVLVDRLWPRGVSREAGRIDAWVREVAPTDALRHWYGHDPAKWEEFRRRYFAELDASPDAVDALRQALGRGRATLLFSSREEALNNAVALREYLESGPVRRSPGPAPRARAGGRRPR